MAPSTLSSLLSSRIDAAMGRVPCDLVLKNARVLDVFSGQWHAGDIAIAGGWIVGTGDGHRGREEIDLGGKAVVPGFIDAHVHVESSCMVPGSFERSVLPCGTTSAICDPHELANVQGLSGIRYFLEESEKLRMNLFVQLSSCVPATHLESNGGGSLNAEDLLSLAGYRNALGLAEVMNVPGVLNGDPSVMEKIAAFTGRPIDGHAPLVHGAALSAYACAGISSCHESSQRGEAVEKMAKGIAVWIREGSVAKDLRELAPLLNAYSSASLGFCTDDRNPLDIATEGHIDHLVRTSLAMGLPAEAVYRSASWTVARHYGLDRLAPSRPFRIGAVAPGYQADFIVLNDVATCAIAAVYKAGIDVRALEFSPLESGAGFGNSVRATAPSEESLRGPDGPVHVIKVLPGKIITDRYVANASDPALARLSVLERYGKGQRPANAYVSGFGTAFRGAIASSVGHDSHNLIVVGRETADMKAALAHLIEVGGGFCVVDAGRVIASLPLPLGGLMSPRPAHELVTELEKLRAASRSIGCELEEPFLQLAFLSLPVIPSLKLTDQGLVDVEQFRFIDVRAS
jgi:adenine deaminase